MKILIIGPSWIGDLVMSQSLYRTIKTKYPDAIIDVMAPAWNSSLLSHMPQVNKSLPMPFRHGSLDISARFFIGRLLKLSNYDRAYVLPNSFKSALVPFFAKIKHRIGWLGEMRYGILNDIRMMNRTLFPLMVQRYIALGYDNPITSAQQLAHPLLYPKLKVEENEKHKISKLFLLSSDRPVLGFCIGAEYSIKRWPYYHYAKLTELMIKENYQVILLGSAKERQAGEAIRQMIPQSMLIYNKNLAGQTNLNQVVDLIAQCKAIVSNDSGLMHIAAALNCSLVALYGPTNPNFTPPLSCKSRIIYLESNSHKLNKKIIHKAKTEYHSSMINIDPLYVYQELINLISLSK